MNIRMLVGGHTVQKYDLTFGKSLLQNERQKGNLVVNDETKQLAKIEALAEDSNVTVYPRVTGG